MGYNISFMDCSLSSFCSSNHVLSSHRVIFHYPKMRSQSFRVNGKPDKGVDADLSVLRERIQRLRKKERAMNTCGWNYEHEYEPKNKRPSESDHGVISEIMGIACGAIGLVFLFGSLCICLVSLLVRL